MDNIEYWCLYLGEVRVFTKYLRLLLALFISISVWDPVGWWLRRGMPCGKGTTCPSGVD